jgi:uncharacterized protein YndB with AHSA1/START domain
MTSAPLAAIHEVRFSIVLAAARPAAWRALTTAIDTWWPADYRATAGPGRMQLEPHLGGRLWETPRADTKSGNGVLWYQVIALDEPASLVLSGFLAPPFGGPALSLLRLTLEEGVAGTTTLELHDSIVGRVDAAQVEAGWRSIVAGLAAHFKR